MNATEFVSLLGPKGKAQPEGGGWKACCPAHDDKTPSLSVSDGNEGRTLIHCHAGCTTLAICDAAGITMADLMPVRTPDTPKPQIAVTYDYEDATGKLLFQVCRFYPKDFRQRRPNPQRPGEWIWSTKDFEKVLFRLPEIRRAVELQKPIFVCEGEKDVLAMVNNGLDATCNPGGAGKWSEGYTETLRGAKVVIIADKDERGRNHAQLVAGKVARLVQSVRVIELPDTNGKPVKDAHDFFAAGGNLTELDAIAQAAPIWSPSVPALSQSGIASGYFGQDQEAVAADTSNHFKNDIGYADAFVKTHGDSIRYCADAEVWLVFDETTGWRRDDAGKIKSTAAEYARELYQSALRKAAKMDPDIGKRLIANMVALGNRKRIENALSFAACNPDVVVHSNELDADPLLVGVQNGVVNLKDGSFQPHRRPSLVTRRLSVIFDPQATCPTWTRFLGEVQPNAEMRAFLQRLSGYALTGEVREHVLPFHFGIGANGKGTFLEHGLLKLFGTYGAKLTNSLVYASNNGALPHLELADLCGRRFALGEENSESGKLNEALLKSITGGDRQKGRFHYGNFVEYFPTYKIALVGNHKPRIDGTDDGIWRRFLLIDWPVSIPAEKRDGNLKDKLAGELPGILNWCIAGAIDWRHNGLKPPESCVVATTAFRNTSDQLAEFIAEHFEADAEACCSKGEVYEAYKRWADHQGVASNHKMSKRALGIQLIARQWQEFKSGHKNTNCWSGFRLKTPIGG